MGQGAETRADHSPSLRSHSMVDFGLLDFVSLQDPAVKSTAHELFLGILTNVHGFGVQDFRF